MKDLIAIWSKLSISEKAIVFGKTRSFTTLEELENKRAVDVLMANDPSKEDIYFEYEL